MSRLVAGGAAVEAGPERGELLASRLFPPEPSGIQWGLERTRGILSALGDPHLSAPTLHVGGTNGKGSVATILASVLRASGLRVGLYTSPHLVSLRERFRVDGVPLSEAELVEGAREIRPALEEYHPSHFEAGTALAFHLFRKAQVDAVVVEVGLGGRLDATNVIDPLVTVVTNVALDHREYLGSTLPAIAREKAGILKTGVPAVVGELRPRLQDLFRKVAAERRLPLHLVDPRIEVARSETALDGTTLELRESSWGRISVVSPLVGRHQVANVLLALRALECLPADLRPGREALLEGVSEARIAGRLQVVELPGVTWLLDVAHNPAGARTLARTLADLEVPRPVTLLAAILKDKDWKAMLPPLLSRVDRAILTLPPSAPAGRRWDPEHVASRIRPAGAGGLRGSESPQRASGDSSRASAEARIRSRASGSTAPLRAVADFERACQEAEADGGTVLATGSCAVVGDALRRLGLGEVLGG